MKERFRANDYQPRISSFSGAILSAALTASSLGIAAWALQSAKWLNPNPPFLIVLILGAAASTLLALKRMSQGLAILIFILTGLLVSVWQSVTALPEVTGVNIWSQWIQGLAKPAGDPTVFIALLVMITWLAGAFGAWYAVRRRNGWISFVLGCLLVILNIVNLPRDFTYVLPLYLAIALALVIQTGWLRSHSKTIIGTFRPPVVPGLALCLVVVLVAFVLPQSPAQNFNLGIDGGAIYSSIKDNGLNIFQAVPSKFKTILSSTQETVGFTGAPDLGDTVRFKIDGVGPGYFATRYYDIYSATGWSSSPLTDGTLASNQAIGDAVQTSKSILVHYNVENEVKTDLILLNGQPDSISVVSLIRSLPAPAGLDLSSLVCAKVLSPYTPYTVSTRITTATANDLAKSNSPYPEWITQRYLQLPSNLPRSVKTLSQQLTISVGGQLTEYEKVVAIENYLQHFAYDIDGAFVPGNTDGVAAFLADRQGNCVNFASALVVMLRSAGVPARFVQGYLGSEIDANGKQLLIYGRDAHAWAEVYFPDYGWIIAEATPGNPDDNFSGLSSINPGGTIPPGTEITPIPGDDTPALVPPGTSPVNQSSPISFPWLMLFLLTGLVVTTGGGGLYITRGSNPGVIYSKLGWLGKLYHEQPSPFDTPSEYARRLGRRIPAEARSISLIADSFARSRYSRSKADESADRLELQHIWEKLSLRLLRRRFGIGNNE